MKTLYLSDFDGTISKQDTLDYIAVKYYPDQYREWERKIKDGTFSISDWVEAFEKTFNISKDEYIRTLGEVEIDRTFKDFIKDRFVVVISGGFLFNIKHILDFNGIKGLPVFGNNLHFTGEASVKISMDFFNPDCGYCGVCKTNIYKDYRKTYDRIVYIGDGITDLCVSKECDIIYVKRDSFLERKLTEEGYKTIPFDTFSQIVEKEKCFLTQ